MRQFSGTLPGLLCSSLIKTTSIITEKSFAMSDFDHRVNTLALSILDQQQDYLDECKEYSKSGHRHNYCFHGVNMWVDYDCACGACEDGQINEYSSYEEVWEYAKEVVESEIFLEKAKQDRKNKMIELIMQSEKRYSYLEAEKIYEDVMN